MPTSGPRRAHSGVKVWATNLDGPYSPGADQRLVSPAFVLPADSFPFVYFRTWLDLDNGFNDHATVEISVDDGDQWTTLLHVFQTGGYYEYFGFLQEYAGSEVRIAFRFTSDQSANRPGWYVDLFEIRGLGKQIDFLDPDADIDSDGLTNAEELDLNTDPRDPDTDFDTVLDGSDNCPLVRNRFQQDAEGGYVKQTFHHG